MPSVRTVIATKKFPPRNIRGLIYRTNATRVIGIDVPTAVPVYESQANPRFPSFEAVLGVQYQIHECWVSITDDSLTEHRFLVAAQYDLSFPVNKALKTVLGDVDWRGDLLVMQGGDHVFVKNMRIHRNLAHQATRRFLVEVLPLVNAALAQNFPLPIPTEL